MEVDYLINIAAATRGHAGVNSNDLAPAVDAIFVENASYYLLGYQATDMRQDGKQRRIEVKVNRPGVEVRARNGYVAEKPEAAAKRKADLASRPLGAALAGILPKSDLPLQLTAVPFAVPGKKEAGVAVILDVRQPIRDTGARTIEKVDLVVRAFDTNGKPFGATNLRADVTIRADASGPCGVRSPVENRSEARTLPAANGRQRRLARDRRQSLLRRRGAGLHGSATVALGARC